MELPQNYNAKEAEKKWQKYWEDNDIFRFDEKSANEVYSIDTPPPTLSGRMHIGHAFSYSQGDFIVRYHRMQQKNVFYPFGTDDNGLPTERLVENLKSVKATSMPRNEFIELCTKTVNELRPQFIQDWKDLGVSADFKNYYSTISKHCIKTSQKSFIDLFHKGRVYREESPISFCTSCQTAIAQAEFDNVEIKSHFNDIIFKAGEKELVIATTRPELLPACVAVVFHPDDERYKNLKGKFAKVPLFNYEVPIIADEKADPEKGTGLVMVCTFGDKTDIEWWRKHKLPLKIVIDKDGVLNEKAGPYKNMKIKQARKEITEDLKRSNILISQKDILHNVNVHERCGTEIEFLKTAQWYIKILDKKQELIEAAEKIKWWPDHMKVRYIHWVENLNWDWTISRQRFFGVPFPVWYCKKCGSIKTADEKDLPVDPTIDNFIGKCECGSSEFIPEKDVMDTWATSSLTPQIALNWTDNDYKFEKMFPMSVRLQAHDIIRTWAFYTIAKALLNNNNIPWTNIMISGHALDPKGEKMSKSKGNVVDPVQVMAKYNADSLRFWAASGKLGDDLSYQEKDLVTGQKMITKLWNASKFCMTHLHDFNINDYIEKKPKLEAFDKWQLAKLNKLIKYATDSFEAYEYSRAKTEAENFFWHDFCDYYLEIIKDRLYNPDKRGKEERTSAQYALYTSLISIIKMIAPIMPHITEEIYQLYFANQEHTKSIHVSQWPQYNKKYDAKDFKDAEEIGDIAVAILAAVRKFKSEKNLSLKQEIKLTIASEEIGIKEKLKSIEEDLKAVTRAESIEYSKSADIKCGNFPVSISIELKK